MMNYISSSPQKSARIMVALSGGVDSATTAALLQQQGHDVSGVFMRNWEDDDGSPECTSMQDWMDAQRVGDKLKIQVQQVNFSDMYKSKVFKPFLHSLEMGLTPNPDVLCNTTIKFAALRQYAKSAGVDYLATGHYARLSLAKTTNGYPQVYLFAAHDKNKCQSYFLYEVGDFSNCLMPLGEMNKSEVRAMAKKFGLHNHAKKDSVGLCFIGKRNFSEFISRYINDEPGDIIRQDGKVLGHHRGLFHYTIGQRQGLGIGGIKGEGQKDGGIKDEGQKDAKGDAWFVIGKNKATNQLVVAQGGANPALYHKELMAATLSWVGAKPDLAKNSLRCTAKIRYRMQAEPCMVYQATDTSQEALRVVFDAPQRAITPGQSVVFYDGERCLGGGIIYDYQ